MSPSDGKAELDREGIPLSDPNKAELDKDGIPLDQQRKAEQQAAVEEAPEAEAQGAAPNRKKMIIIGAAACGALLIVAIVAAIALRPAKQPAQPAAIVPVMQPTQFTQGGEIILDPFIVSYRPIDDTKDGILIAQVSLEVNPRLAANIRGETHAIRELILDRLSTNAPLYSKQELSKMISKDLEDMDIKRVSFIRYDLR